MIIYISENLNEQAYYIIDNNGNFGGKIILKKSIWTYFSFNTPITCWYTKTMAVLNILMLRELANLSGLNDINWFIVYGSEQDLIDLCSGENGYECRDIQVRSEKLKVKNSYEEILWSFGITRQ